MCSLYHTQGRREAINIGGGGGSYFDQHFLGCLCDVTLSVYPHRAGLKNMPGHGGNRTYDLWNTSPLLCQLSYVVRSVRVCDISELSLVPSISV